MKKLLCLVLICILFTSCSSTAMEEPVEEPPVDRPPIGETTQNSKDEAAIEEELEQQRRAYDALLEEYRVEIAPDTFLPSPVSSVITASNGTDVLNAPDGDKKGSIDAGRAITVLAVTYGLGDLGEWCFIDYNGMYGWVKTTDIDTGSLLTDIGKQ